uniref:Uncharacterized protein n=1 Tax=Panagrolaimus davidi TaxID=227884 RepID=A0A914QTC5_9BILA
MGLKKNVLSIKEIEDYITDEFGEDFFNSSVGYSKIHGAFEWYADQSLFGYKVDEWLKIPDNKKIFSYDLLPYKRRIDRAEWPTPETFSKMKIEDYDDCHQPVEPYANGEWEKYKPFLEFAFRNDEKLIKRFTEYRKDFII